MFSIGEIQGAYHVESSKLKSAYDNGLITRKEMAVCVKRIGFYEGAIFSGLAIIFAVAGLQKFDN